MLLPRVAESSAFPKKWKNNTVLKVVFPFWLVGWLHMFELAVHHHWLLPQVIRHQVEEGKERIKQYTFQSATLVFCLAQIRLTHVPVLTQADATARRCSTYIRIHYGFFLVISWLFSGFFAPALFAPRRLHACCAHAAPATHSVVRRIYQVFPQIPHSLSLILACY